MTDAIDEIRDIHGNIRRLGSLKIAPNHVSAFNPFEKVFANQMLEDADIRKMLADPNRKMGRNLFGTYWNQNQLQHGSCNGFAEANALGKARFLRGIDDKLKFSGAFAYSLMNGSANADGSPNNRGADNGSALEDGMLNIQKFGICPADLVTANMIYRRQQPANVLAEAAKHKGIDCFWVQTIQGAKTVLAMGDLLVVAVQAGPNFQKLNADGICGTDHGSGNHAIHADDIVLIKGKLFADEENQWGLMDGQNGRRYALPEDQWADTIDNHHFYAVVSTEEAGL